MANKRKDFETKYKDPVERQDVIKTISRYELHFATELPTLKDTINEIHKDKDKE